MNSYIYDCLHWEEEALTAIVHTWSDRMRIGLFHNVTGELKKGSFVFCPGAKNETG